MSTVIEAARVHTTDEHQLAGIRGLLSDAGVRRLVIQGGHTASEELAGILRLEDDPITCTTSKDVLAVCQEDVEVASVVPVVTDGGKYIAQEEGGISNVNAIVAARPYAIGKLAMYQGKSPTIMAVVVGPRPRDPLAPKKGN